MSKDHKMSISEFMNSFNNTENVKSVEIPYDLFVYLMKSHELTSTFLAMCESIGCIEAILFDTLDTAVTAFPDEQLDSDNILVHLKDT